MSPVDHRREYELVRAAADRLQDAGFGNARVVIQTGSGIPLPGLSAATSVPWSEIPGLPAATAPGHEGRLHHGLLGGVPTLVLQGRLHLYEGHEPAEIVRLVRAVGLLGIETLILTNASGGVREGLGAGDIVLVEDHVNLLGCDPLRGVHDPRFGDRFPVMTGHCHDEGLRRIARERAADLGITLVPGVYAGVPGPSFETPAEVRRLRTLGIDACGMSTIPEVLAATQLRMKTLVLSLVANPAGQVSPGQSAEREVLEVAARTGIELMRLVTAIVEHVGA